MKPTPKELRAKADRLWSMATQSSDAAQATSLLAKAKALESQAQAIEGGQGCE